MEFSTTKPDPFRILASTKRVLEEAKFVSLNTKAVNENVQRIDEYLKEREDFPDHGHRLTGNFETDVQLIFFESAMGFCFWAKPGEPKWGIEMPDGEKVDGWYGVAASFKRAHDEGVPVAEADFLATLKREDVRNIFRTATGAEIPLLDERVAILRENSRILNDNFKGKAARLLEVADYDVVKLFHLLLQYFPSYRDIATYNGTEVVFLKIAHLLALDIEYRLTPSSKRPFLKNFEQLCVFADYKLPQILRMFGVLEYEQSLAGTVDSFEVIPAGSPQEVEMRAGAIWGVELFRQQLPEYSSVQIGHVIWLMSQDKDLQAKIKPYHRTYTTFY